MFGLQELLDKSDAEDMDANAAALEDMYAAHILPIPLSLQPFSLLSHSSLAATFLTASPFLSRCNLSHSFPIPLSLQPFSLLAHVRAPG